MAEKVNPLIRLSPNFLYKNFGPRLIKLRTFQNENVTSDKINDLIYQLNDIISFFTSKNYIIKDNLVSIEYKNITPKSRRAKSIFRFHNQSANHFLVGAKFEINSNNIYHVVTYFVPTNVIANTINDLKIVKKGVDMYYGGSFKNDNFNTIRDNLELAEFLRKEKLSLTNFKQYIADVSNIRCFKKPSSIIKTDKDSQITFFSVFNNASELQAFLNKIGISNNATIIDDHTAILKSYDLEILQKNAPFIIAQSVVNLLDYDQDSAKTATFNTDKIKIKEPNNEPTIGVFDSMFDSTAYFSHWVEFHSLYPDGIIFNNKDKSHGTKVSNIIVDGPSLNPWLNDGCGNFKVRLFGIATEKKVDVLLLYEKMESIVRENNDIKVWNISLGDRRGVDKNYISVLAAKIDFICKKYNVIFIISGTNVDGEYKDFKIGSPADSLNALVVNSVDKNGNSPDYTRTGPVLTLFTKPDVSYYGGTLNNPIFAYSPTGNYICSGTSFAAPWISRKAAYLIHYLHLEPLVAKALIIDSAASWDTNSTMKENQKKGYGIVPIHIDEIVKSKKDEIKFVISDSTIQYITCIQTIPVPFDEKECEFYYTAKATLCYFTDGNRKRGVDYTSTELDVKFGRNEKKENGDIKVSSINKDKQHEDDGYIDEAKALVTYQKWNNTKRLVKPIGKKRRGLPQKFGKYWGLEITHIERNDDEIKGKKYGVNFGIVITIKNIYNEDADIQSFIRDCAELKLAPSIVNENLDIELYNEENADIKWE